VDKYLALPVVHFRMELWNTGLSVDSNCPFLWFNYWDQIVLRILSGKYQGCKLVGGIHVLNSALWPTLGIILLLFEMYL